MKQLNQFIIEYIVKKKLEKPINSEDHYEYFPKTKKELIYNIKECLENKNYNLNCIDTSKITDMSYLFSYIIVLSENEQIYLDNWDVSNVKNMESMFRNCYYINPDLSNWDVSNVKNMTAMFYNCKNFTGEGIKNWNVSNVESMDYMFSYCESFTGNELENWNVSIPSPCTQVCFVWI